MRISDWSSDVCSSDLTVRRQSPGISPRIKPTVTVRAYLTAIDHNHGFRSSHECPDPCGSGPPPGSGGSAADLDRKRVVSGKSVAVRVDLGGRGRLTKKKEVILIVRATIRNTPK